MADEQDMLARMAVEDFIPRGDDAMVEITQTLGIFGAVIHWVAIEPLEQAGIVAGDFIAGLALPCPKTKFLKPKVRFQRNTMALAEFLGKSQAAA